MDDVKKVTVKMMPPWIFWPSLYLRDRMRRDRAGVESRPSLATMSFRIWNCDLGGWSWRL